MIDLKKVTHFWGIGLYGLAIVVCTIGRVENGVQRVFKNLLAFFAAIWYID